MPNLNATHDPTLRSWVDSANDGTTDFPIQNLPLGRFRRRGGTPQGGVAIGDRIVDLRAALALGLFDRASPQAIEAARAACGDDLLPLLRLGNEAAGALRAHLCALLAANGAARAHAERLLVPQAEVEMLLPTTVRQFTDMCASTFHIGRQRGNDERGEPICPPVFRTLPVGYDGRASSVVCSGTPVRRPLGTWQEQLKSGALRFGPEPRQDYELELGAWIGGPGNRLGEPMGMNQAADALFGFSLVNDWSARGIQFWEAMLGPFLGKSLATTAAPWIVTAEALAPFRIPAFARPQGDPEVPTHLHSAEDQRQGGFDITLESHLATADTRARCQPDLRLCSSNFRHMYWTFAQMVAHHASNGCALAAGDLIASGTCSGPALEEAACLAELHFAQSPTQPGGAAPRWLQDGDRVTLRGRAQREGYVAIGFGEASGELLPAPGWPDSDTPR
ncbi:fumarylacetoacetate hydrolase family protein [Variovorax sp.]|jgi:fumarylacetoacetase|uniref:fumarylacetoacetate hydrolase family protein n=1 Tax=Variovorax sp. TaxID=1871043 RepID=UPI0037D9AD68